MPDLPIPNPMKSISTKLTLAFLLLSLTVAGFVAFFTRQATEREFESFVVDRIEEDFVTKVTGYYQSHDSWRGIREIFPPPKPPSQPLNLNKPKPAPIIFALADEEGSIIIPAGEYRPRQIVAENILAKGTPIIVDGVAVGTALLTGKIPELDPVEQRYLERTNQALLLAMGTASMIALILGAVLARSLTRPLRELTTAARSIARGELEQKIPVHSKVELGELIKSFNQMSANLAQVTESRRQMTADIAHDLGSPLTVIGGYLEAIEEGVLEATPERIAVMHTEITHLQYLVRDLRMLSLADAGQMPLNREQVETGAFLRRVAASYKLRAEKKGIRLKVEVAENPHSIYIDEERMAQALGNLVSNALRHTPKGSITLATLVRNNETLISVADTGAGIAEEDLSRIFERFYRTDQTRNLDEGESGLGLAITRAIIETHGGKITVKSKLGEGTKFIILLKD
ncbi:MAG TPA: HAMP domain-containing histidine kinase [Anaerolineales bacterium]|nr:HAMP domain-containing histidine kinase [Anaerolineales bacterium]